MRLYESLKSKNNMYLFLDYCDSGDLEHFMERHPKKRLTEKELRHIT